MSTPLKHHQDGSVRELPAAGLALDPQAVAVTAGRYAAIALQLVAVVVLVQAYQLESRTFYHIMLLAVVGFAVHAALPRPYRLPFFAGLSVAGLVVAFGWTGGGALLATGMVLIGACHLPIRWGYRVAVLIGLGAVLGAGRGGVLPIPLDGAVWAILGSMFMFRIALYMQAVRQDGFRFNGFRTLAYFFMLPNVVFPLYPVVDYTAFERNHYDDEDLAIYETGVHWIARGLLQLVLYRFVYQFVVTDAAELTTLTDLLRFLLGTYLLYLRVSGSFHLIVGLLYLFGFRLPETHHLYYLASGFTDFWRRINIYWKDFMMKLVYYPSFFRLRRRGTERALIAATIAVFIATWVLHSYQWFWLRGGFPLTLQDLLFWGLLGALVVRASLKEMRKPRSRKLVAEGWSLQRATRTVATFVVLCVLWSLWSSESVLEWVWMWRAGLNARAADVALLTGLLTAGFLVSGRNWGAPRGDRRGLRAWLFHPSVRSAATLVVLLGLSQTDHYEDTAPVLAGVVTTVRTPGLNARDAELQHRGYYEKLDNPSRMSADLWATVGARPARWDRSEDVGLIRHRDDFLQWDLQPDMAGAWNGVPFTTNRWGMRDRDYPLEKPANGLRIAILGQSHIMGSHVPDDAVFDQVLEERVNRERGPGAPFEAMNFGVASYALTQQLALLESRVLAFHPDIVVITAANHGRKVAVRHLLDVAREGLEIPYPHVRSILEEGGLTSLGAAGPPVPFERLRRLAGAAGIQTRIPYNEALARARFAADDLNAWAVVESARRIREAGAVPILLAVSTVGDAPDRELPEVRAAREAGVRVFDLFDVFDGVDPDRLRVAPWDNHPNREGHRRIANRLYDDLTAAGLLNAPENPAGP